LSKYRGDLNQALNELLAQSPPMIERNVLAWFDYFDPSRFGLSQEDIIHALELTYGSDIREFDFNSSVKTMWPPEIPLSIKLSREVFAEPGEGLGIGIAEYASNLSPIITDVNNLAKVVSPLLSRQTIFDTLKACNFDKFSTLRQLQSKPFQQTANMVPNPPSQLISPQYHPPPHNPPPYSLPPSVQFRCSRCHQLVTPPLISSFAPTNQCPFICQSCQSSPSISPPVLMPTAMPSPPIPLYVPSTLVTSSPHSGFRPQCGISPAVPAPPMSPIHPQRNNLLRKALLVGINYSGQRGELRGCCNDVREIYRLLTGTYGWSSENFRILSDERLDLTNQLSSARHQETLPTKRNILNGLRWLGENVFPGDALFFHYSGHGAQQPDPNGIESDGMNETILPGLHLLSLISTLTTTMSS
jgi:hypothetical protein